LVLRKCLPVPPSNTATDVVTKTYAPLLRKFASGRARTAEAHQIQYIVAVQLFVNELGHPQGLMSTLFRNFYSEEVGVILCSLLCCLHDKKHCWQVPLFS
jgi:hypothetical protein